jgi:uncharacterized protein YutE (UPF0331/DUF86 family)
LRRIIAVDTNRSERGLAPVKHQGGLTIVSSQKALEGYREQLGEDTYNDMVKRSDAYFDEYKKLLTEMRNEGLINQTTYDMFAEVDYQPTQYLDFLEDMEGNFMAEELDQFESVGLSQEQIKTMKGGSEGRQLMDSQLMLKRSILVRTKAKFANKVNKTFIKEFKSAMKNLETLESKESLTKNERTQLRHLRELQSNVKLDKVVGFTESGKPKYALEKTRKKGFSSIYFYENGVPQRALLKDDFHKKFTDTNNQIFNARTRKAGQILSGTAAVKTMATGKNPLFFITNVPRDLAFAVVASPEMSNNVAVEGAKAMYNFLRNAGKVIASPSKNELFQQYIEHGGGMDFLSVQGQQSGKILADTKVAQALSKLMEGTGVSKALQKTGKAIDRINEAAEIGMRMTVFDRAIQNRLKEQNVTNITELDPEQQETIYAQAVRSARELADFNQGGTVTKAGDAIIPYLNAATQGTRAFLQKGFSTPKRAAETTFRMTQIAGIAAAATIIPALALIQGTLDDDSEDRPVDVYFETLKGVSDYDLRNYYIIPNGKRDSKGELKYYRVAKAQALTPFINAAENAIRSAMVESYGDIEYEQDLNNDVLGSIYHNLLPLEINPADAVARIPAVDATFAAYGYDAYTGNPLDYKKGKIPARLEGKYDDRVEEFYKELGETFKLSPARMKGVTESIVTTPSTNPIIGGVYTLGDLIIGGDDAFEHIDRTIGASWKRLEKSTSEYNRISKLQQDASEEAIQAFDKHMRMEKEIKSAVREAKRTGESKVVIEKLENIYKEDELMLDKALRWGKSEFNKKKVNPLVNSLKFQQNKEARAIMLREIYGDALIKENPEFTDREKKIFDQLVENKVIDKETYSFYKRLVE